MKPMFYFLCGIILMSWSFIEWKCWWFYYFTSNFELDVNLELLVEVRACNFWLEQIHKIIFSGSGAEWIQQSRVIFSFIVCWIKALIKIIFNTGSFPSSWRQTFSGQWNTIFTALLPMKIFRFNQRFLDESKGLDLDFLWSKFQKYMFFLRKMMTILLHRIKLPSLRQKQCNVHLAENPLISDVFRPMVHDVK